MTHQAEAADMDDLETPDAAVVNDPPPKPRSPIVLKRTFSTLIERPVPVSSIEVRMDDTPDSMTANFRGYASTTGTGYAVNDWLGEYRETINPGAFAKTLREQTDVPLLFNHDGFPLASTSSGTSRLSEDGQGLLNEATLDRSDGNTNTVCVQLKRGVLNKMSFSFRAIKDDWNDTYDERGVSELALYDTSIVTYPANPSTTAELRSAMQSLLGREGTSLMWSIRTAMDLTNRTRVAEDAAPLIDNALRALADTDEVMCRRHDGYPGRARTFAVAGMLLDLRQGKALSAAREAMLRQALSALHDADNALQGVDSALDEGQAAIAAALNVTDPDDDKDDDKDPSAIDADQGGGSGGGGKDPLLPADGAGPRHLVTVANTRAMLARLQSA